MNKFEDLLSAVKLGELMNKKNEKKHCTFLCVLAIVGAILSVAGIAYLVYKHFSPDYLEDFDDDEYEDDDFDDDEIEFSSVDDDEEE